MSNITFAVERMTNTGFDVFNFGTYYNPKFAIYNDLKKARNAKFLLKRSPIFSQSDTLYRIIKREELPGDRSIPKKVFF